MLNPYNFNKINLDAVTFPGRVIAFKDPFRAVKLIDLNFFRNRIKGKVLDVSSGSIYIYCICS